MAITTNTFTINAGYARSDLIKQLENAFTWLGWHDSTPVTGIVTGWSAVTGTNTGIDWTNLPDTYVHFEDLKQSTTSGIGTGMSLYLYRYRYSGGGQIQSLAVNSPGYGYTNGEYVTFPAGSTGPSSPSIGMTVYVSNVSYGGTTNAFYHKSLDPNVGVFGVLKHKIQDNKKFGTTYRSFYPTSNTGIMIKCGRDYHPQIINNSAGQYGQSGYVPRMGGVYGLDVPREVTHPYIPITYNDSIQRNMVVASSNSYQLDLNVYRSGIDPKFAVFSYRQPTLSSTSIFDNTFETFIFHNFISDIWDLNDVFLGGYTRIYCDVSTTYPRLTFETHHMGGNVKRMSEWGYDRSSRTMKTHYYPNKPNVDNGYFSENHLRFYYRNSTFDAQVSGTGNPGYFETVSSNANFNAVVKGIPLNGVMVPVPYYMPDDFVLLDFYYSAPSANIQQGDTITISGSEVYTVITGIYNQTTNTKGLLFCARKV